MGYQHVESDFLRLPATESSNPTYTAKIEMFVLT